MTYLETAIHLMMMRAVSYLEEKGSFDCLERFPGVARAIARLQEKDIQAWAQADFQGTERLLQVLSLMSGSSKPDRVLQSVLELSLAVSHLPEFAACLQYYTGSGVTLHLAYEMEGILFPEAADARKKLDGLDAICYIDRRKCPILHAELHLDDRVFFYLMGDNGMDRELVSMCKIFRHKESLHPLYAFENIAVRGAEFLQNGGGIIQLTGRGGRRFLARHICRQAGRDLLSTDVSGWNIAGEFSIFRMKLIREALFQNAVLCVYGITHHWLESHGLDQEFLIRELIEPLTEKGVSLIFCSEKGIGLWREYSVLVEDLPSLSFQERRQVWEGFSSQYGLELDCIHFAARYYLDPSEVAEAFLTRIQREGVEEKRRLSSICYEIAGRGLKDSLGTVIYPSVTMEDLKVTDSIREILTQIIASANGTYRIFEEWNLKKSYPYGRAVTVLLTGPPGTGKTMSAHAIAQSLGIPLYQVNLSNIVDKYIGETEKHLEEAFSFAEKTNMVLFFDEADSLFGKRSEVSDAKDKYANTEVSYLLQRLEQYHGTAIMATNFQNNIDPAFLRRIKYAIRFLPPDEEQRLAIWKSCIPEELPCGDLDLPYLAKQFDFSGGTIKNVLLNSCVIALAQNEPLNMLHILKAVRNEYIKMDRPVSSSIWGEYGYLQP